MQNNTNNDETLLTIINEPVIASLDDGFLRIANKLMKALCLVNLSDRESRILNAVILKTYGFNKSFDWISGSQFMEITGIDKSNLSKMKRRLFERNILIKQGRKIGVNPIISDWVLTTKQTNESKATNTLTSQSRPIKKSIATKVLSKQTKEIVLIDKHNKQNNKTKNTNTKGNTSSHFYKGISFESLSKEISIEAAQSFIDHRKILKVPLTQRAFDLAMNEATKAQRIGLTPDQAIDETIAAGWKGIKLEWLSSRLEFNSHQGSASNRSLSKLDYTDIHDTTWADNLGL